MKLSDSVVYCDNHLLVARKPAGICTQPDFEEQLKVWVKDEYKKSGAVFLHALHRLDRPVSGLVLFARSSKALSRLNEQVRAKAIRRIYLAEVEGILLQKEGRLEHFLRHGSHCAVVSCKADLHAKQATLTYRVLKILDRSTQIEIELETGRYHQIRAQFAAIGHPIVGDHRYGAKENRQNIQLHCAALTLEHPVTKEILSWKEPASF